MSMYDVLLMSFIGASLRSFIAIPQKRKFFSFEE